MATANTHNNNPLPFTLVWFDANADSEVTKPIRQQLEKAFGDLVPFTKEDECDQFTQDRFRPRTAVLIVSGQFGEAYVKKIHDKKNILSIFVFCSWKEKHEIWARQYTKVKAVVTSLHELIDEIKKDRAM